MNEHPFNQGFSKTEQSVDIPSPTPNESSESTNEHNRIDSALFLAIDALVNKRSATFMSTLEGIVARLDPELSSLLQRSPDEALKIATQRVQATTLESSPRAWEPIISVSGEVAMLDVLKQLSAMPAPSGSKARNALEAVQERMKLIPTEPPGTLSHRVMFGGRQHGIVDFFQNIVEQAPGKPLHWGPKEIGENLHIEIL